MKNIKTGFTKSAVIGVFAISIFGLTGCSSNPTEPEPAFGVEDLPNWVREMTTDEEWQYLFDGFTPEELELFFTEGLGSRQEMPTPSPGSGHQMQIVAPGQGGQPGGSGIMIFGDDGWEDIDYDDLHNFLE